MCTSNEQSYGRAAVLQLLERVADGSVTPEQASERMRSVFDENVKDGEAHVDHQRALRTGLPEVVFGEGKTPAQIAEISKALARHSEEAIVTTRVTEEAFAELEQQNLPNLQYWPVARVVTVGGPLVDGATEPPVTSAQRAKWNGPLVVLSAGTCDLPVAEETAVTAQCFGIEARSAACYLNL